MLVARQQILSRQRLNVLTKFVILVPSYFFETMEARRDRLLIIWILGALATVSPFAIDLYLPAFNQIAEDFGATPAQISISVSSYFVGMALGQILYGPLLDRFGRKRPLYFGLLLFVVATVMCAQSDDVESLAVFRFVQAIGGSVAWVAAVAMVRDFFPVNESARIFSLLILILGVSPLLAPTLGGFIAADYGWKPIFYLLAIIGAIILLVSWRFLPEGHQPDTRVSLKPGPILRTFLSVLRNPIFHTYTFAGAFSFATLFIYVAGSPVIFMEIFHVSPEVYGGIFALLSVSFIGGSQMNILLTRRYPSAKLFAFALMCQVIVSFIFVIGVRNEWFGLYSTIGMFFLALGCIGICNPNANALAISPFTRNVGSASALLGCTQIGVAALASSGVALFKASDMLPIVCLMAGTATVALIIHTWGKRSITAAITASPRTDPPMH